MTVSDLISLKICKSRIIALDAKDGKMLFDTRRNKAEFLKKYYKGDVCALWSEARTLENPGFGHLLMPVVMIYVTHKSWEEK